MDRPDHLYAVLCQERVYVGEGDGSTLPTALDFIDQPAQLADEPAGR